MNDTTPRKPATEMTLPELESDIDRLIGLSLHKGLSDMLGGEGEVNAALIGKAMEWRDGKGQKKKPGQDENPVEQALASIRAAHAVGRPLPPDRPDDEA